MYICTTLRVSLIASHVAFPTPGWDPVSDAPPLLSGIRSQGRKKTAPAFLPSPHYPLSCNLRTCPVRRFCWSARSQQVPFAVCCKWNIPTSSPHTLVQRFGVGGSSPTNEPHCETCILDHPKVREKTRKDTQTYVLCLVASWASPPFSAPPVIQLGELQTGGAWELRAR